MNGLFQYIGMPAGVNPVVLWGTSMPNTGSVSPVRIASITDGLSNTIALSEHAHGLFSTTPDRSKLFGVTRPEAVGLERTKYPACEV